MVTDEDKLRALIEKINSSGKEVQLWDRTLSDGSNKMFAFGAYNDVQDYYEEDIDDYVPIYKELQDILPADEAILIFEAGNEKLRYVNGYVTIITANNIEHRSIRDMGIDVARELLGDKDFTTHCEY